MWHFSSKQQLWVEETQNVNAGGKHFLGDKETYNLSKCSWLIESTTWKVVTREVLQVSSEYFLGAQ